MTKEQIIAIDIDDVLAENAAGFAAYSNSKWGTNLSAQDYDDDWSRMWPLTQDEIERRADAILREAPNNYTPIVNASSVLQRLREDYTLLAVTSRRVWMREDTQKWLSTHYNGIFSNDRLYFAGIWDKAQHEDRLNQTKADIIDQLGADFLIDDQLKHRLAVAHSGRRALLFGDYNWNQQDTLPSGVERVRDWRTVEEYFYG